MKYSNDEPDSFLLNSACIEDIIDLTHRTYIPFGIPFLDRAIYGMTPQDLLVVGAASGIGKTAFALEVAKNALFRGKRVLFLALEAEQSEIEMRLRYQILSHLFFSDPNRDKSLRLDYRSWRFGFCNDIWNYYCDQVKDEEVERYSLLHTYYKNRRFTINDLTDKIAWARKNGVDLVVLDHLHYINLDPNKSEFSQISEVMHHLRTLNLAYQIPTIVVSHLRKDFTGIAPTLADFMGHSDIGKVATTAIMISKQPDGYNPEQNTQKTLISIPKNRAGGVALTGVVDYDLSKNTYSSKYCLAYVQPRSEKVNLITDYASMPKWAKDDVNCRLPNQV